jgi:hypothetical protein
MIFIGSTHKNNMHSPPNIPQVLFLHQAGFILSLPKWEGFPVGNITGNMAAS